MSLEYFGKFFFSLIRPSFFYALLALFPLGAACLVGLWVLQIQKGVEQYERAAQVAAGALQKKNRKSRFLAHYAEIDPYFLNQHIETFPLLEEESKQIQELLQHPAAAPKQILQERFRLIGGSSNRLSFGEKAIQTDGRIKETEEKQGRLVQMDRKDLEKLCAWIEGVKVGSFDPPSRAPQMMFLDFRMKRVKNPLNLDIYEVQTELLKREWVN